MSWRAKPMTLKQFDNLSTLELGAYWNELRATVEELERYRAALEEIARMRTQSWNKWWKATEVAAVALSGTRQAMVRK